MNKQDKQGALRYNEGKREWSLVDFESLEPMVEVLEFGAKKYAPHNWKKGLSTTKILESMLRHVFELLQNKDLDEESKLPIIGHVMCNAMFYAYMVKHKKDEWDDRFKNNP